MVTPVAVILAALIVIAEAEALPLPKVTSALVALIVRFFPATKGVDASKPTGKESDVPVVLSVVVAVGPGARVVEDRVTDGAFKATVPDRLRFVLGIIESAVVAATVQLVRLIPLFGEENRIEPVPLELTEQLLRMILERAPDTPIVILPFPVVLIVAPSIVRF